jgi:1-acyl-sn-glycerol-3-phosphate acyltransferase
MVLRQITDEIMFELRSLSGQDYVNSYAKRHGAVEAVAAEPARVGSSSADVEATSGLNGEAVLEPAAP